ncbi:hypothetical protein BDV38DRAFT_276422 [Aspergillus pseudotamarii]|uniref:NB-ARC domain-containing protein n=1 Tax=Aspergillus pseudotamarii TaxID=132259 RepID=A0A5N6S8H5_ASPPS|nr:uncharacterized protein BDV38DRAFT_276422 [Aspergillus pseudotamarii]KAE8130885.1 hypothetical protein BDV38DRAFT_276422 [Aspergillus pseudotamarii]
MRLVHDDHTVAWICALPLEVAVTRAMLDEVHMVVTSLRAGVHGTISATAVVSGLVPTYQNVQFRFIFGVIQYDYGKTLRNGQFQHTVSLDKPPKSDSILGKSVLGPILTEAFNHKGKGEDFSAYSIAHGQDILYFETEAAGLMDKLLLLIIQEQWQGSVRFVFTTTRYIWLDPREQYFWAEDMRFLRLRPGWQEKPAYPGAICGLGGIGKTHIAVELTYRTIERDSECSIFCILYITEKLGMTGERLEEAKDVVKSYLSREEVGRWLLILDYAEDIDVWFCDSNSAPKGHILFITRNQALATILARPYVTAITLLEQLAFLPLGITQAAAYINENEITIYKNLELLRILESEIIDLLSENFQDDRRQKSSPLAGQYLLFMGCLSTRSVPQSLLPPAKSENDYIKAIGLLKAYFFISTQAESPLIRLNQLIHLAIRSWMQNNDYNNRKMWCEYLAHISSPQEKCDFKQ